MLDDYFLPTDGLRADDLLSNWRWLIGDGPIELLAVAAIGNLFLKGPSGRVYLLEIEDGDCQCIADSADRFRELLGERHNRTAWLQTFLVRELRNLGRGLEPGQCYALKVPAVLCGERGIEKVEVTDLRVHVSMLGQIHRQVRALPPGSTIDEIRIDAPEG